MKIPDAYFSGGFGQQTVQPAPVARKDISGDLAIGQSLQRFGGSAVDMANTISDEEGRKALAAAHARQQEAERIRREEEARLEKLEKAKEHGLAQGSLFSHENTLQEIVGELAKDKNLDPQQKREQFSTMADQTRANFITSVPEEYQYAFAPAFDQHKFQAETALNRHLAADIQTTIKAQLGNTLEEIKRSPKPLAAKLALVADLQWEEAGFDAAGQADAVQKFREELTSDAVTARFNTDNPREILKDLNAVDKKGNHVNYAYLEPKTRESFIHTAKSRIEQQEREAEAERRRRQSERNEAAKMAYEDYRDARQGLLTLDPKREASLWRAAQGTPYFDKMRDVKKTTGGIDFLTKKISEDPLKYGAAQMGIVVPTLDASDPASWPGQLQARGEVAKQIKTRHGLPYLPVLTNDEAKGLSEYIGNQSPQGTVKLLKNMTATFGGKNAGRIAQQFAAASPELGTVAGLVAAGREDAAELVAQGQRLVKEKAVSIPQGMTRDMQAKFDSIMGDALTGMPQARGAFLDAAKSAYIAKATAKGQLDDSLDNALFKETVREVVGSTAKINGKRVLLPTGMNEGQFRDFFKRIGPEQIRQAGGVYGYSDPAKAADDIRGDARLVEAGEGRYRFTIDGKPLYTADGKKPFTLEIGVHGGEW